MARKTACSACGEFNDRLPQRYCRECHNAYARANRPRYFELSTQEKRKASTRAYTRVYERRGKLDKRETCQWCGSGEQIERHHIDYARPLDVVYVCRNCHRAEHRANPHLYQGAQQV